MFKLCNVLDQLNNVELGSNNTIDFTAYVGCFTDNEYRLYDFPNPIWSPTDQTIDKCMRFCKRRNFIYSGLEVYIGRQLVRVILAKLMIFVVVFY